MKISTSSTFKKEQFPRKYGTFFLKFADPITEAPSTNSNSTGGNDTDSGTADQVKVYDKIFFAVTCPKNLKFVRDMYCPFGGNLKLPTLWTILVFFSSSRITNLQKRRRRSADDNTEATTESLSPKELRVLKRIEELSVTYTGEITADNSSCVPEPEIKWDQCVNRDESIAGTPDSTIDNTGIYKEFISVV